VVIGTDCIGSCKSIYHAIVAHSWRRRAKDCESTPGQEEAYVRYYGKQVAVTCIQDRLYSIIEPGQSSALGSISKQPLAGKKNCKSRSN